MAQQLVIPKNLSNEEVKADLLDGLYRRLINAAWLAQRRCEDIAKNKAQNGYDEIRYARAQLDLAERFLAAIRELEGSPVNGAT